MTRQRVVRVYDNGQPLWEGTLDGPIEFGRVEVTSRLKFPEITRDTKTGHTRVLLARANENYVSRHHVLLRPIDEDNVEIANLSQTNPVYTDRSEPLPKCADPAYPTRRLFALSSQPLLITLRGESNNTKAIRVEMEEEESALQTLAGPSTGSARFAATKAPSIADLARRQDHESLQEWLRTLIDVLQSAANSNDFFQKAAHAVVNLVGMDTSTVMKRDGNEWHVVATAGDSIHQRRPSNLILSRICAEKQTIFRNRGGPSATATLDVMAKSDSLMMLDAVVAAPFFDEHHEVTGVLYGERFKGDGPTLTPSVSKVDASLVQALAHGIEVGLRRVDNEHKMIEAQVRFEQFFTPELARELTDNKNLLNSADRDVSVLFCDIRSFSTISEALGLATLELVGEFLDLVSAQVIKHEGVVVDFIGDELLAMWGAPREQPNHAELACRAGLDILAAIAAHDKRWIEILGKPLRAGVGINTGEARVGNVGSSRKFKYGPLGNTVNLASRVQGANKYLRTDMLITENTRLRLGKDFSTRRIRKVRVVNIGAPIDLFEVWTTAEPERERIARMYEGALALLEQGDYRLAARKAAELVQNVESEGPSLMLASQALQFATNPDLVFSPEWTLPGK